MSGHLDERALVLEGGAAQGFFIKGWAALDEHWAPCGELMLVLRHEKCSFTARVAREPREDVASARGAAMYRHTGYRALVPVEPLHDGDYQILIQLRCDARTAWHDTGFVLSVRQGRPYLRELDGQQLLHVVHVPKTGGTSFRPILQHMFGAALALQYEARLLIDEKTRCIQGHNYASSFLRFQPETRLVMWFRDPVERVISEYFHWRRNPHTHPLDGEELLNFARRREMVNLQRRCLDGLSLSRIECIGLTEHFHSSVALFGRVFGVRPPSLPAENVNPDKAISERYDVSPALREQLALANQADLELHSRATERFFVLCRQYDVPFAR